MKFTKSWLISSLVVVAACGGTAEETVVLEGPGDGTAQPPGPVVTPPGETDPGSESGPDAGRNLAPERIAAPSDLTARADSTSAVTITWSDNATNEAAFVVERRPAILGSAFSRVTSLAANTTSFTDAGLSARTEYIYRVRATTPFAQSDNSNEASVTTEGNSTNPPPPPPPPPPPAIERPSAPLGLSARATGATSIRLTWRDRSTNEDGFVIERHKYGSLQTDVVTRTRANVVEWTDTGLLPSTKYIYEIRSFNAAGTSYLSDRADATTPVAITAPTGVTATAGNWQVRVTWNAVSGADEYKVYRSTRSGGSYQLILYNNRDLELSDASVSNGTTYYYVVVAENAAGQQSAFSREVSATPRP